VKILWISALSPTLYERAEVQQLGELASVVEFDRGVCDGIVLEPHQVEVEHRRKLLKNDPLLCILQKIINKNRARKFLGSMEKIFTGTSSGI
jgi:hypothetical protein